MMLSLLSREALSVSDLERYYRDLSLRESFVRDTISAFRQLDADCTWRAVWLLRRFAQERGLDESVVAVICEEAAGLTHWLARLNLCQLLAGTGCPTAARDSAFAFLSDCAADRRAIVRAWAFSALYTFQGDPEYRSLIDGIMRRAHADKSKSVQARLRQMKKPRRPVQPA